MKIQNGADALAGSACPKKATELFYVTQPKAPKALPEPFMTEIDTDCGHVAMRSADAQATACLVDSIDELNYWHAVNNGRGYRAFVGSVNHG